MIISYYLENNEYKYVTLAGVMCQILTKNKIMDRKR